MILAYDEPSDMFWMYYYDANMKLRFAYSMFATWSDMPSVYLTMQEFRNSPNEQKELVNIFYDEGWD